MKNKEILYICMQCKTKENISKEVVEYFDEMDQSSVMNHLVFHAKNVAE